MTSADTANANKPAATSGDATQVKQLREELDRLKKERDTLRERLSRYEKNGQP